MAYEYGTQKLNIRNPFRFEGLIRSIRGLIITIIGIYLLSQIQTLLQEDKASTWMAVALGTAFVAGGLAVLSLGLFQMMRFFVGRAAPTSLAKNLAREAVNEQEASIYTDETLHRMLMNKSNPTFYEPLSWFNRAVHSIFPRLITTPWPVRNLAQSLLMRVSKSLVVLLAYLIASLILYIAMSGSDSQAVDQVVVPATLQLLLLLYLVTLWTRQDDPLSLENMRNVRNFSSRGLAILILVSIAAPVLILNTWNNIWNGLSAAEQSRLAELLPRFEPLLGIAPLIALTVAGVSVTTLLAGILIRSRGTLLTINTNSSERNDSWRYDLHPRQIFTTLRDFVLMQRREQNLPNRAYLDNNDTNSANRDNEEFNGDLLVEIQPLAQEQDEPAPLRWARILGTVCAQLLLLGGALLLWWLAERSLEHMSSFKQLTGNRIQDLTPWFEGLIAPLATSFKLLLASLLIFAFGRTLWRISNLFWAEIFFKSQLFDLHCEGTVMRSRHFRGADRHSASSEQDLFSFDATYFALGAQALSSTFAVSGQHNLEQPRYLLSFSADDGFLNGIIEDLQAQFQRRDQELKADKQADKDERLDYIRREQEARRTGDMTAQGLTRQAQSALGQDQEGPLPQPTEREQIKRWEGEDGE